MGLFTVSHLQVADVLKYGTQAQAWRDIYHERRPMHVHAIRSWRTALRNWVHLHDACEFLGTFSESASRKYYKAGGNQGITHCQSCREVREQHFTNKAITWHIPDAPEPINIQSLIDHWHQGGTYLQACSTLPRIAMLRISRFKEGPDGALEKLHTKIRLTHRLQLPQFNLRTKPTHMSAITSHT